MRRSPKCPAPAWLKGLYRFGCGLPLVIDWISDNLEIIFGVLILWGGVGIWLILWPENAFATALLIAMIGAPLLVLVCSPLFLLTILGVKLASLLLCATARLLAFMGAWDLPRGVVPEVMARPSYPKAGRSFAPRVYPPPKRADDRLTWLIAGVLLGIWLGD